MATVTAGYNWVSGETVTPAKLNSAAAPTVVVADNEVTTSKIANLAVTDGKLASTLNLSGKTVTLPNTSVSLAQLVAAVQQSLMPVGAVQAFAMSSAPSGWLNCTGQAVSRTDYAALFAVIGTAYGTGNGSTTFNVPDLRGYFIRGWGTNGDGTASGSFASKQADEFKSHNHGGSTGNDTPDHFHLMNAWTSSMGAANGTFGQVPLSLQTQTSGRTTFHTHPISGEGGPETRPKNIAMLYCIKA
jgi:microcystin-dependent protein